MPTVKAPTGSIIAVIVVAIGRVRLMKGASQGGSSPLLKSKRSKMLILSSLSARGIAYFSDGGENIARIACMIRPPMNSTASRPDVPRPIPHAVAMPTLSGLPSPM